jgi:hypothetical protein
VQTNPQGPRLRNIEGFDSLKDNNLNVQIEND